jgi:methylase of polypeptide subunit release factors
MIDISKDTAYTGEGVRCVFSKPNSTKTTFRIFKDEQSALNMATFIAAQHGINDMEKLKDFLTQRSFEFESIEENKDAQKCFDVGSKLTYK